MTELSKIFGQMWKNVDAKTKAAFEKKNAASKARYAKEMAAYKKTPEYAEFHSGNKLANLIKKVCTKYDIKCKSKPTKFPSDPNQPKRGVSSYVLFGNAVRPRIMKSNPGA